MKKKLIRSSIWVISLLLVTELVLRFFVGLGEKPLYEEDEKCEYRLQSNQDISRFHNSYRTNSYGMRSKELSKKDEKRIVLFGDSVLNGGSKIDQDDLVSTILETKLNEFYQRQTGVYNVSAGSWGPENAYQFMEEYVDFEIDLIVLIFSSHDYNDNMHHRKVVGEQPAWPNRQHWTAIGDLYHNWLVPKVNGWTGSNFDYLEGFDDSEINPGWRHFIDFADLNEIPIIIYHHADVAELNQGHWFEKGEKLEVMLSAAEAAYISGLERENGDLYLDNVHMNEDGHELMSAELFEEIIKTEF